MRELSENARVDHFGATRSAAGSLESGEKLMYVRTQGDDELLTFEQVLLRGLAPDGGLYVPNAWPKFSPEQLRRWRDYDYHVLAAEIMSLFVPRGDDLLRDLIDICRDAYSAERFPDGVASVRKFSDPSINVLELFR